MTIQTNRDLPLTFRSEVVEPIFRTVAAGDSCSIIGIGSVGKSNLLRFLGREDVRRAQLGDDWSTYLFVYVDINKILKLSPWGLFELMLHQLLIALADQSADPAILDTFDELHQRATNRQTRYLALRYLDRAVRLIRSQLGLRLVFLLDEFDELCRNIPAKGFSALRALRDDYKYHLMYIVTSRLELKRLREETKQIEAFEELVSPHTFWLGPYTEADARDMLHRLESRYGLSLAEETINKILTATGGHPGLLREGYRVAREHPDDFFELLINSPQAQAECQRVWFSLSTSEQQAMIGLAAGSYIPPNQEENAVARLGHKGLVRGTPGVDSHIFSSLLAAYIKGQNPAVGARIHVDPRRRAVTVNGYEIRDLTPLEYDLMAYLIQKRGQLCSRDELAQHLYPDDMALEGEGVTDTRLHSLVKRLRKRVEPDPKEPRYILTVRGHGFRLVDGEPVNGQS